MAHQLPLPVTLRDEASFTNFYLPDSTLPRPDRSEVLPVISSRVEATQLLRAMVSAIVNAPGHQTEELLNKRLVSDLALEPSSELALGMEFAVYLWGPSGSGKTHLVQACCRQVVDAGRRAMYLPLAELMDYPPQQVLVDLEHNDLVCVDDIHLLAGQTIAGQATDREGDWQQALFDLYNRLRDRGSRLLLTGLDSPGNSDIALADLKSRLAAATGFALSAYSDEDRVEILCFRAQGLGLSLSPELARYLISRAPRDINTLIECLHRLDREALAGQRKLTIPFVKAVFEY